MTRIALWILVSCGAVLLAALPACDDGGSREGSDADSDSDGDGDCGTLADGDSDISGHSVLDGSFAALLAMRDHADAIRDGLDATVADLCQAFEAECPADVPIADRVAELKAEIEATVNACVEGPVEICHVPPECSAGIAAGMAAMYECESGMGCEVDDGCLSSTVTECDGTCNGACSGECSGYCEAEVTGWECLGLCDGSCETTTAEDCFGTCEGTCAGNCHGVLSGDSCDGICSGTCLGTCEACAPQECPGGCTGICLAESYLSDFCEGTCHGACTGACDGGCWGDVEVWSCDESASCEATADCQQNPAQLMARAEAACTEAEVEAYYTFDVMVDAGAQAAFAAKMDALAAAFGPLEQATFENLDLCDVDWCNEHGFQPGLVVAQSIFEDLWQMFEAGELDYDLDSTKQHCVEPAFEETWALLDELLPRQQELLAAQLHLLEVLNLDP